MKALAAQLRQDPVAQCRVRGEPLAQAALEAQDMLDGAAVAVLQRVVVLLRNADVDLLRRFERRVALTKDVATARTPRVQR